MNCYGHSGGHEKDDKAHATDFVVGAMYDEMAPRSRCPIFLIGDLNADISDIPMVQGIIDSEGWNDLGEANGIWLDSPDAATCRCPNTRPETRRDYIIANTVATPLVESFEVLRNDHFSVHQPNRILLKAESIVVSKSHS